MRPFSSPNEAPHVTAARAHDDDLTDPVEITARSWHHALNAQQPTTHHNDSFGESFTTAVRHGCADIYVRINERHVTFQGAADVPHHVCIRHALTAPVKHRSHEDHAR